MSETTETTTTATAAPAKKVAAKKVPVKGAAAKGAAAKKTPAKKVPAGEPKVSKGEEWLPKIVKYLAKNPEGKTKSELCEHFDAPNGFSGALINYPEFIKIDEAVEGRRGRVFSATKKGIAKYATK